MQFLIFTHNDLDGVSCGILAKYAFKENAEVRYNSVNSLDYQVEQFLTDHSESIPEDLQLFITDLSVNKENEIRLNEFANKGGKVQLIDHHKTALHFNEYNWGAVKVEESEGKLASATSLFYTYLVDKGMIETNKILEDYVELVRQYDTWEWEKNENLRAKRLNDLLYLQSIEEFDENMLARINNDEEFSFSEFEDKLLDVEEDKTERYIRRKKREIIQARVGKVCIGIVYAELYHSELGNALGKEFPYLDCIAILNMGNRKISFRTIHDTFDVSELAAKYGGGGHAKAAGCSLTKDAYKEFVEKPFSLKPIRQDSSYNKINMKEQCSHYENHEKEEFLLFEKEKGNWAVEKNHELLKEGYQSFELAERFIKRSYSASLSKDDQLIGYLMKNYKNKVKK
ncbi:oligoribonuclease NrnB/cAMP/cGMP phosphodiesterase (DHH superfamily) [Metabacillus crassostreae]|uniref:DHH family phosphoesterase n=1 Tax=Metabacillus crassostreae TaxID=929098 RepID=UPI00195A087E|nr:DHHA1 domain-containing protein [Metabacillus crassostreae]MBM7602172.1 oligoribonuclease NrnB/cAMP/cGMP phosphodiesterase (DHH superfamily) [Metabacillus crassostreae]